MDKTHTDYILEGLMEGSEKFILFPIINIILDRNHNTGSGNGDEKPAYPSYLEEEDENMYWLHDPVKIPMFLVQAARFVNPF